MSETLVPRPGEILWVENQSVLDDFHSRLQAGNPKKWWKKFLADPEFRLEQELEAHREEYRVFCGRHRDRNVRSVFLRRIAKRLADPMYGGLITPDEAIKAIR